MMPSNSESFLNKSKTVAIKEDLSVKPKPLLASGLFRRKTVSEETKQIDPKELMRLQV
jgi:hypothetical protein